MLYANKNKTLKLLSEVGLQLPERWNNLRFDTIIHQSNNIVNNNIRNNDLNDASKIQNSVVRRRDKAQEAIDKYKESGDVRDLPPNSWASGYARDAKSKVIHIENQLAEAEYNAKYNAETQEDNAALTELIKKLEQKHDEALAELGIAEDLRETIKSATLRDLGLSEIAGELHDIDGWKTNEKEDTMLLSAKRLQLPEVKTKQVSSYQDMIPVSVTDVGPVPTATKYAPTSRAIGVESSSSDNSINQEYTLRLYLF